MTQNKCIIIFKKYIIIVKNYITRKKTIIYSKQISYSPEETEELESAAFALSRKFRLSLLRQASAMGKGDEGKVGQEVHGWMQIIFKDRYKWLFKNDVFDLAINYALKYYNPEVFNSIKDYDFKNAIVNIMYLPEIVNYDKYQNFGFNSVVILTQGKTFENSVTWIHDLERYENGYRVMKTVAPCNFLNMGFTLWDKPVLVLKDAVGMEKIFFEAKTSAEQITNIKDQLLKMHIYTKRQEEETMDEKIAEMEEKYNQLDKKYHRAIDEFIAGDTRNPEEKFKNFIENYENEVFRKKIKWKKLIIGVLVVAVIGLLLIGITKFL